MPNYATGENSCHSIMRDSIIAAIALNPGNVPARECRAIAYINRGDLNGAINDFSEAIRRDPLNARIYGNRAGVYRFLGQFDKALADLDHCLRLSPELLT